MQTHIGTPLYSLVTSFADAAQVSFSEWAATAARGEIAHYIDNPNNYSLDYFRADQNDGPEVIPVDVRFRSREQLRLLSEAAAVVDRTPEEFLADACAKRARHWIDHGAPVMSGIIEPPTKIDIPDTLPNDWVD